MKKKKKLLSILRLAMYRYTILTLAIVMTCVIFLFYFINLRMTNAISEEYEERILDQLQREAIYEAGIINNQLTQLKNTATFFRSKHELLFSRYDQVPQQPVVMIQHANGTYFKVANNGSSVFYSDVIPFTDKALEKVRKIENLEELYRDTYNNNDLIAQVYFNTSDNMNRIYPPIENVSEVFGNQVDISVYNFYYRANEVYNPDHKIVWTDPYLDPAGQGWIISILGPVYNKDNLEGVVGLDVPLRALNSRFLTNNTLENRGVMLVNDEGFVFAFNDVSADLMDLTSIDREIDVNDNVDVKLPEGRRLEKVLGLDLHLSKYRTQIKDKTYIVTTSPVSVANWTLIMLSDYKEETHNMVQRRKGILEVTIILVVMLVLTILLLTLIYVFRIRKISKSISGPIVSLAGSLKAFGVYDFKVKPLPPTGIEEVDDLSREFSLMASQIQDRTNQLIKTRIEKTKAEEAVQRHILEATTDTLTKVYNRRKLDDALNNELNRAKRYDSKFSLILLDVDNFKEINDAYGHAKGDDVLVGVARILMSKVRASDIVSRWGGDEFVLLIVESDIEKACRVANKIRESVVEYYENQLNITTSIGVAEVDIAYDDARSLLQKADVALYEAKRRGKNCVVPYNEVGNMNE